MFKERVRTVEEAFAYVTDCTLATVSSMAMKRSRSKGEYQRQISIAQTAVDWMRYQGLSPYDTRAREVIHLYDGSVLDWAQQYEH
jgi:hypothetical protein